MFKYCNYEFIFLSSTAGPSEENNIDSITDTSKSVDSSENLCDINGQVSTGLNQSAQLSLSTISAPNVEAQQVSEREISKFLMTNN